MKSRGRFGHGVNHRKLHSKPAVQWTKNHSPRTQRAEVNGCQLQSLVSGWPVRWAMEETRFRRRTSVPGSLDVWLLLWRRTRRGGRLEFYGVRQRLDLPAASLSSGIGIFRTGHRRWRATRFILDFLFICLLIDWVRSAAYLLRGPAIAIRATQRFLFLPRPSSALSFAVPSVPAGLDSSTTG